MAQVFSASAPYGRAGYLRAKFQLRSPPSWPPNGQGIREFCPKLSFRKGENPAIAPP